MNLAIRSSQIAFRRKFRPSCLSTSIKNEKFKFINDYFWCQTASCSTDKSDKKSTKTGGTAADDPATKSSLKKIIKLTVKAPKFETKEKSSKFYQASKYITRLRAMNEYCLADKDLEGLAQIQRRSAYIGDPPTIMFYESDVEKRSIKVHGSREALRKAQRRAKLTQKTFQKLPFFDDPINQQNMSWKERIRSTFRGVWREGRVVVIAIGINSLNCGCKFAVGFATGSHSMIAEGIHSLMDTINQLVLAIGIHHSIKKPDKFHPYGYMNVRHITSLISGVAFFCLGAGLSCYHGFLGLYHPQPLQPLFWAFITLGFSLLTEGGTLVMAYREIRKNARTENMTIMEYIRHGDDPSLNVVLLEDLAAVTGVAIASASLGLSFYFNSSIPDACGSIAIGGLLGLVASSIIYTNSNHLVGRSMPEDEKEEIVLGLEQDPIIRSVQDVKTTELGGDQSRFKAEVDLNGYEMTKVYLQTQNLESLLLEVQQFETQAELENFMLMHGEQIVDCVGGELDRIEKALKAKHPDVTHVDLEVL